MLTVGNDAGRVERMLEEGSLCCPVCGGRLARWGHGRERVVFGPVLQGRRVRPRRSRCTACRVTHVLLPARLLARRPYEAAVTGAALAAAARGDGYRRAARELGCRRTRWGLARRGCRAGRAGPGVFTRVAAALSADPVPLERPGRRWPESRWSRSRRRPRGGGAVAGAARGVAVGGRVRGHERDLAGPGDGGPGAQREFPLVR